MEKYCRRCGVWLEKGVCPRCSSTTTSIKNRSSEIPSSGRVWILLGLACFLVSVAVLIGTMMFVENRRQSRSSSKDIPSLISDENSANTAVVKTIAGLNRDKLIAMLPAYTLSNLHSDLGKGLPDDLRVIAEGEDQYLVVIGTRLVNEKRKQRLLSVFKLENGGLVDLSKETIPEKFKSGMVGDESTRVEFTENSVLELAKQIDGQGTIEDCPVCEHAFLIERLVWQEGLFQLTSPEWKNDPYTAAFAFARALDKKQIDEMSRPLIAKSLDAIIAAGFEHRPDKDWTLQKIASTQPEQVSEELETSSTTEEPPKKKPILVQKDGEEEESIYYLLDNSIHKLRLKVTLSEGRWITKEAKREDTNS
ncbi:MAG: hypothetical protein JNN15_09595 [Blastocatellia bacterium]|nr:hypothetical protein [Blastocatellia bacterium]